MSGCRRRICGSILSVCHDLTVLRRYCTVGLGVPHIRVIPNPTVPAHHLGAWPRRRRAPGDPGVLRRFRVLDKLTRAYRRFRCEPRARHLRWASRHPRLLRIAGTPTFDFYKYSSYFTIFLRTYVRKNIVKYSLSPCLPIFSLSN